MEGDESSAQFSCFRHGPFNGSVIDADAVCVMDQGCCAEYGAPHCLLQRSDSAFARLVATSGEETELRAMAAMRPAVRLPKDQLG